MVHVNRHTRSLSAMPRTSQKMGWGKRTQFFTGGTILGIDVTNEPTLGRVTRGRADKTVVYVQVIGGEDRFEDYRTGKVLATVPARVLNAMPPSYDHPIGYLVSHFPAIAKRYKYWVTP